MLRDDPWRSCADLRARVSPYRESYPDSLGSRRSYQRRGNRDDSCAGVLRFPAMRARACGRQRGSSKGSSRRLSLHEFSEHLLWVDGDEDSLAAGQDLAFFVHNLRHVDVLAAVNDHFPALDPQRLMQRHWLQVFHGHLFRQRDYVTQLVHLAHRIVEDAGDDASVTVSRWARVAVAQVELADKYAALFIERERQPHSLRIVRTADEAGVAGNLEVIGFVAVRLTGHATHSTGCCQFVCVLRHDLKMPTLR